MKEDRRVLTAEEKAELRKKHGVCYICLDPLENYEADEIQYDHIYSFADGYPQELSNFAPVHASDELNKANCHKSKGKKSPVEYREELRVLKALKQIKGLKDLCPKAVPSVYSITESSDTITINGTTLPLYNQRIGVKDNYYFFTRLRPSTSRTMMKFNCAHLNRRSSHWSSTSSGRCSFCQLSDD
jgi:hypothetical protein